MATWPLARFIIQLLVYIEMLGTRQEKHIVVFPDDTDSSTCKLLNLRNNREKCKGSVMFSLEPIQGKEI